MQRQSQGEIALVTGARSVIGNASASFTTGRALAIDGGWTPARTAVAQ